MAEQAIGMIECKGFCALMEASDAALKAANVTMTGWDKVGSGLVTGFYRGDVAAVKAADLAGTLSGEGPFTVFAPTNAAFAKLPDGTVETLLKPENKATLQAVLTYHVVAGRFKAKDVMGLIEASPNGMATIKTVQGETLMASIDSHGALILTDQKGGQSKVVMADVNQSNGVIHAIDTVVMPG